MLAGLIQLLEIIISTLVTVFIGFHVELPLWAIIGCGLYTIYFHGALSSYDEKHKSRKKFYSFLWGNLWGIALAFIVSIFIPCFEIYYTTLKENMLFCRICLCVVICPIAWAVHRGMMK